MTNAPGSHERPGSLGGMATARKRPRKRRETFDAVQRATLWRTAQAVYDEKFRGKDKPQVKMGLALGGLSQSSISALLRRKYTPSVEVAEQLAHLAGLESLRDLVGDYYVAHPGEELTVEAFGSLPGLHACITYHGPTRWPAWVVAAAKAGAFPDDVTPAAWAIRLDDLAKKLG